jgi:hypothetical protein
MVRNKGKTVGSVGDSGGVSGGVSGGSSGGRRTTSSASTPPRGDKKPSGVGANPRNDKKLSGSGVSSRSTSKGPRKRESMSSSTESEVRSLLSDKLNTMNVGEICEEDFEELVGECASNPEVEMVGPSFAAILFSDILTLVIFSTAAYMTLIYVMNYFTSSLLE